MYYVHNRLLIAALHFNENYGCKLAKTLAGSERIRIFSQAKQGEFTPNKSQFPKLLISIYFNQKLINFNEHILQIMLMTLYRRPLSIVKMITSQHYPQLPLP